MNASLESLSAELLVLRARLDDHMAACIEREEKHAQDMAVMRDRIDGAYARMWITAGSVIFVLIMGVSAALIRILEKS